MDHEDAYDMTTYDEEIVINGDDDRMRNLIAKRQRKVANRHDLFHKHGLNKRRLKHGTLQLDHLLL